MVFRKEKSLEELEAEDERLDTEVSVAQKKAALIQLKQRGMHWKPFSSSGKFAGVDWGRVIQWLKTH